MMFVFSYIKGIYLAGGYIYIDSIRITKVAKFLLDIRILFMTPQRSYVRITI